MAGGYGAPVLGDTKQRAGSFTSSPAMPGAGAPRVGMWTISHPNKMKYSQMFSMNDRNKRGHLTGVEARSILMQSGLPQHFLAQIWSLSDVDNDGKLVCEEFCIAMHLVEVAKTGQPLPAKLPAELIPPGMKGRAGSIGMTPGGAPNMPAAAPKDSFGDLLGGMGMNQPPPMMMAAEEPPPPAEEESPVTFEDKRKMNFDKGQAELDRRRAALQEQIRRDEDARLEKERREQEKRDRIRQEQEQKRQQALERQMEKQRQIEREKEEQRRKMMEQREAAKREQERQRQMEWERLRKEQLLAEKHREYQQLESLKSHNNTLKCELEAMDGKKVEIRQKIEQIRIGVTDFTTSIETMRQTRDDKLTNIEQFDHQLQELSQKYALLQKQRDNLNLQVQTTPQTAPVSDTYRTVLHSVETKKKNIQNLKDDLERIEKQTANKLQEIDTNNLEFTEIKKNKSRVAIQQQEVKLQEKKHQEEKQKEAERRRQQEQQEKENRLRQPVPAAVSAAETEEDKTERIAKSNQASWFSGFKNNTAGKPASSDIWGSSGSSTTTQVDWGKAFSSETPAAPEGIKYRALYQFDAKNQDEISFQIGDIVVVPKDQSGAEPGWMSGVVNGKKGWFPEKYVEIVAAPGNQMKAGITLSGITEEESHTDDVPASDLFGSSDDQSFPVVQPPSASPTPGQGEAAPEGMQVQACYPWKAKKENHLTFNKGDLITVKEQQDMWWSGELNGKLGWFPKSYVKPVTSGNDDQTSSESPSMNQTASVMSSSQDTEMKFEDGDNYVAMYPYTSEEMTDLTFKQGDVVTVTHTDGDWWTGKVGNRTGIFPANYVKKVELQAAKQESVQAPPPTLMPLSIDTAQAPPTALSIEIGPPPSADSLQSLSPGIKTSKKPEIATVIAPYTASGSEQLSLQPGQLLQVRKKSASGWWEGELQARGQKRKIGWFPANYVKLLGSSSARSTPVSPAQQNTSPADATSAPVSSQPSYVDQVVALYDYVAQNDDELTFHKDSVLNVVSKDETEWWKGELNGQIGMFPSNYAGPLASTDQSPLAPSWSSDPAVIATTSAQESKRQNAIQELITTEESYNKDMSIVLEIFCKPFGDTGVLSPQEIDAVFVNWTELIVCNIKLLKSLRVRKKFCKGQPINIIGDILCENLPHMTPYIRFCSCQLNAAALIQHKTENSPEFNEVHRKCTQDPRTKGMPLSSFMLKPMQRITRYPLLINKILQYTPEEHHDHQHLTEALANADEQCSQVNEAVHEKDNSDKLEWIQQHVQCDGLPEKITFNSVTNCLGPRKFMYSGTLYKIKSNKELVAFLFNDFLLLTQPIRPLGSIVSVFSFDTKATTQYRMYKQPIVLNEIMVKKASDGESDPCQFQISHIDRVYNLKTVSPTERDSWYKNISNSQKQYLNTERRKRERAHSLRRTAGMGRLVVVIVEGRELRASDANGKSDPYCEVSMGSQEHKTKVINSTLNPKWNASMQFMIKDLEQDVLCITVYDRDLFSPNDFLGRTEVRVAQIQEESKTKRGPITKSLVLHEVDCGEVTVKLDLLLFEPS